jgi:hypothetical protein
MTRPSTILLAKESGSCEFSGAFGLDDAQGSVSHPDTLFSTGLPKASTSAWILVVSPPRDRPIACGPFFSCTGAVLMRAHDSGVDHHVFVVVIVRQQLENSLENPAPGPPAEALVDDFPITEALRKVTPRDARPISEQNGLDEQPIIRRRAADMAFAAGQKILDPIPLVVA